MKRLLPVFVAFCTLFSASVPSWADDKIMTIGTGSVNGVYYPAGGAICRLVNRNGKEHGVHCFAESTAGSVNNIQALRDGEINFAIVQSDWQYKAYYGKDIFADQPPYSDLRSVFSLHSEMFTVAVSKRSGIHSFAELKGKRVNIGDGGSGIREIMSSLMEVYHWKNSVFASTEELKPADAARALCAGKIDAMVFAIGHPNGLIQDITATCGARLVAVDGPQVDKLIADNPYYAHAVIPGGMYRGNPEAIPTFGVKATLITSAATDEETVYQLTKAVFDNFDNFKTLHFVFADLDRERMVSAGLIAPLHPGALRYYREIGLIKDNNP
jgi:TRAP transporter TAXI family solute receptor